MTTVEQRIRELVAIEVVREVLAERARCAAVCREVAAKYANPTGQSSSAWEWSAEECAEAIERGPVTP